jgi:ABC-type cobalamin/Fe3+-siderophores transport system ATPase subunit
LEVCGLLSAHNLSFAYGGRSRTAGAPRRVVGDVSLEVAPGAFIGILGPNGSGKTTLVKLLAGLLAPTAGDVLLDGQPVARWSRRALAQRIAMVPQELHPAFDYTVLEMTLMGRFPHLGPFAVEGPADIEIARQALEATGALALEDRPFSTLSGGEKQRVVIAAALAQQADVMLLDEPTASLDPGYQLDIAQLLTSLNRTRGLTMVLATHDLNLAASVCRDLVMLRAGTIIASGPTDTVLTGLNLERLYDVRADVRFHDGAGHLTVVPLERRRG